VKIVLVQLADKARHVAVLEMLGKNGTSEFFILSLLAFRHQDRVHIYGRHGIPRQPQMYRRPCPIEQHLDVLDPQAFLTWSVLFIGRCDYSHTDTACEPRKGVLVAVQ
jgi:hypothetical protein